MPLQRHSVAVIAARLKALITLPAQVLIVMKPGSDGINTGVLWAFLCSVCVAIQLMINR